MSKYHPFGATTYTLGTSLSSTDTSIILSSFLEPVTGTPYTMALLNSDIAFGTIAPKTTSSEFVSFTGITQNANGTATLTGVVRGLAKKYPFTTSASYKLPHAGQSQFIISDVPQLFEEYVSLVNDATIAGLITFTQPPVGINPGGQPNASDTVIGVTKLSVAAASAVNPIAAGINDPKVPAVDVSSVTANIVAALAGTGTPNGTTGKYVTNDDTATAATASKVARRLASGDITVNTTPTNATDAASKAYVDTPSRGSIGSSFETAARFDVATGTATRTFGDQGIDMAWATSNTSSKTLFKLNTASTTNYARVKSFLSCIEIGQFITDNTGNNIVLTTYQGIGAVSETPNFNLRHVGIKSIKSGSGAQTVSVTNGNGTAETATDITASWAAGATHELFVTINATNILYYVDGVLVATHTTNIPQDAFADTTLYSLSIGVSGSGGSNSGHLFCAGFSVQMN